MIVKDREVTDKLYGIIPSSVLENGQKLLRKFLWSMIALVESGVREVAVLDIGDLAARAQ